MPDSLPSREPGADHDTVDALARLHRPALLRYFQRKGFRPPEDEDATQEVLFRLARREGLAADVSRFEGYLFSAAAHVAADLRRAGRARRSDLHEAYDEARHAEADHDPEEILQGRQALGLVVLALGELPERTRVVFMLARLERMKQGEIARRLGISLSTVEKHLQKAVAHLGQRVGRRR